LDRNNVIELARKPVQTSEVTENVLIDKYSAPGWRCLGLFHWEVGSWLLFNEGEALLLELPALLTPQKVEAALEATSSNLKYLATSHHHLDHLWRETLDEMEMAFPDAHFLENYMGCYLQAFELGGEPLYLLDGPKHSDCDRIVIFKGVAMTGDIELGTLDTINGEIDRAVRAESMAFFAQFEAENNYHVHTIFSAHLNDHRTDVAFSDLFRC
jgi:hypothetical protein